MDVFYDIVFGIKDAFYRLCNALPVILDAVIRETHTGAINNTVYEELRSISSNTLKSLYLLAFSTYEGFNTIR